jgi:hypothetical protein
MPGSIPTWNSVVEGAPQREGTASDTDRDS